MVDQLDPTPLKVQLANLLRAQIESGELAKGQKLPSESTLQQRYEVSRGTVREAVKILQDEGLVITIQGRATYVALPVQWTRMGTISVAVHRLKS